MKKVSWGIFIAALVITLLLIALEQYYVAVSLVVGTVIMRHRELWSLVVRRRLPPVDERVKANTNKAVRNGFVFLAGLTAFLMLPLGRIFIGDVDTQFVLAGMFLLTGLVYLLSYIYYDRAAPKMSQWRLEHLRGFLMLGGVSIGVFIIAVFLHNVISGYSGFEEPVFFIIAVILAPLALAVSIIGSLALFIMGLAARPS
jgi:hypothetical protein